jgi:transposase
LVAQVQDLTARVGRLDQDVVASVKAGKDARRLTSIRGVGPIIAATVSGWCKIRPAFDRGVTLRPGLD